MNQPEIAGGPWWIVRPDGKRVGAVYSWHGASHTEVWFLVKNQNNNALFANWPATALAQLHFVPILSTDDVVDPGDLQNPQPWVYGASPSTRIRLPRQSPQVTYEEWQHTTITKSADATW